MSKLRNSDKFSDLILKNTSARRQKEKINKLEENLAYSVNDTPLLKTKKEEYVKAITENPDFDSALTHTYDMTLKYGSQKDQKTIKDLKAKHKSSHLEYDDIDTLEKLTNTSYHHLFSKHPNSDVNDSIFVSIIGTLMIIGAIIMRCFYNADNTQLLPFLVIINMIAIAYTIFFYPIEIIKNVKDWLILNNIQSIISDKILGKLSTKIWSMFLVVFTVLIISLLICHFVFSILSIANDIISIFALGLSVLQKNLIQLLSVHYQRKIFNNKA